LHLGVYYFWMGRISLGYRVSAISNIPPFTPLNFTGFKWNLSACKRQKLLFFSGKTRVLWKPLEHFGMVKTGEGGIRTHVQVYTYHLISSQRRYGHFGTSPSVAHYIRLTPCLPVTKLVYGGGGRAFGGVSRPGGVKSTRVRLSGYCFVETG
jgi:hypothetical protein